MRVSTIQLPDLEIALEQAWSEATTSDKKRWSPMNPAWGQCAVTAVVVNDVYGGRVLNCDVLYEGEKISHYFNELPNGRIVDFTRRQFPAGTIIPPGTDKLQGYPTTRDYVLSRPDTVRRYEILQQRVLERLLG